MGTDDFFKKRQEKTKRNEPNREAREILLIITEGYTEQNYLNSLIEHLKIDRRKISINFHGPVKDADKNIETAKKKLKSGDCDEAYCVFDRDNHASFPQAIKEIKQFNSLNNKKIFEITSNPCFEYWILLHFKYTTRLFGESGSSACEDITKDIDVELKKIKGNEEYIKTYDFSKIIENFQKALENAKKANKESQKNNNEPPYTKMDILVSRLYEISIQTTPQATPNQI